MKSILVIAPHPDDETLGCGGTLLKLISEGYEVYWLIATNMSHAAGFTSEQVDLRSREITDVVSAYPVKQVFQLKFCPAELDNYPMKDIVSSISSIVSEIQPQQVFVPYRNDAHSDHGIVFDAAVAAVKSFRAPSVERVLAYETLSETEFDAKPESPGFRPNVFINIEEYLERKIEILRTYQGELAQHPFPRSIEAVRALSILRGVQSNLYAAEAFMLIKEVIR